VFEMKNGNQIVEDLNKLAADLCLPLSKADEAAGWTTRAQGALLNLLNEIREALVEGRPIPNLYIGRGLDHWGVVEGDLLERACALSISLRGMR
jgi:hypothetical protein